MDHGITLLCVHNYMVWYLETILKLTNVTNIILCVQLRHTKKTEIGQREQT